MQHCYACSEEALDQCKSCQQWFCARHGEGRCDRCRDLPGGYPSGLVYRGVLGTLVVALGLAGWHLWAWPQFPLPEPRMLAALAAAETNVPDVTPVEPTPAPTVAATQLQLQPLLQLRLRPRPRLLPCLRLRQHLPRPRCATWYSLAII